MCGIIAIIAKHGDKEKAREALLEQYENQYGRGTRGFGLIEVTPNGVRVRKATEPIKALLDVHRSDAGILLFHHRMPTSTDNTLDQAHPMFVSNAELLSNWYICHNGTIRNADTLKKRHEELGYIYTTHQKAKHHYANGGYWDKFNDSEAMAIELARYLEGKIKEVEWEGPAAFIGVKINKKTGKPGLVTFGRGENNPLQMKETADNLILASDIAGENVFDHDEKKVSILTLKAIANPSKWNKNSKENTPLMEMAFTNDLIIKKQPVTVIHHARTPTEDKDKTRPLGLLAAGRDEKDDEGTSNAVIHWGNATEGPTDEDLTPRQRAFYVMASKTMTKVAGVINLIFENLSEGEVDDKDMSEYMDDIRDIIQSRFKGAQRARYHLDRMEDMQLSQGVSEIAIHPADPLDTAIEGMEG